MGLINAWRSYSAEERRNITLYIGSIILYKLGLGFFDGSITTLATDGIASINAFTRFGVVQGLNQTTQCIGAILTASLVIFRPSRFVLVTAALFSLMSTILLIVDTSTSGKTRSRTKDNQVRYGNWNPNTIFAIWTLCAVTYGMIKLIRRVM